MEHPSYSVHYYSSHLVECSQVLGRSKTRLNFDTRRKTTVYYCTVLCTGTAPHWRLCTRVYVSNVLLSTSSRESRVLIRLTTGLTQTGGMEVVLHTITYTNFKPPPLPLLSLLLFSIIPHFAFHFCNAHSSPRSQVSCAMMLLRCLWWMVVTGFPCLLLHFILARFVLPRRFLYCLVSFTVCVGSRTGGSGLRSCQRRFYEILLWAERKIRNLQHDWDFIQQHHGGSGTAWDLVQHEILYSVGSRTAWHLVQHAEFAFHT